MTPMAIASAAIAVAVVLFNFVAVMMRMPDLPDRIPTHFNIMGRPDRWGPKKLAWIYPGVSLFQLVLIAGIRWNAVRRGGPSRATDLEAMSLISAFIALSMLAITLGMVSVAHQRRQGLGWWFLPAMMVGLILILFRYARVG